MRRPASAPRPGLGSRSVPRHRSAVLALSGLMALAGCGEDGETLAPGNGGEGALTGVVARQKTAEGVPGVVVALLRGGSVRRVTVTDASGGFSFQGLESGSWRVRPAATELAGLDVRYDAMEPVEHEVTMGEEPVELVFAVVGLVPPRITGRVTCGGAGAEGVRVRVVGGSSDVTATADAAGLWSALELEPGSYAVLPSGAPCALSPAYRVVELRPGQLAEADFQEAP